MWNLIVRRTIVLKIFHITDKLKLHANLKLKLISLYRICQIIAMSLRFKQLGKGVNDLQFSSLMKEHIQIYEFTEPPTCCQICNKSVPIVFSVSLRHQSNLTDKEKKRRFNSFQNFVTNVCMS